MPRILRTIGDNDPPHPTMHTLLVTTATGMSGLQRYRALQSWRQQKRKSWKQIACTVQDRADQGKTEDADQTTILLRTCMIHPVNGLISA